MKEASKKQRREITEILVSSLGVLRNQKVFKGETVLFAIFKKVFGFISFLYNKMVSF